MRNLLAGLALLCAGMSVAAPAAATEGAFGPPPECVPKSQQRFVGLETETWTYLRTEGDTHYYDYAFTNFEYGEVSCTA